MGAGCSRTAGALFMGALLYLWDFVHRCFALPSEPGFSFDVELQAAMYAADMAWLKG